MKAIYRVHLHRLADVPFPQILKAGSAHPYGENHSPKELYVLYILLSVSWI